MITIEQYFHGKEHSPDNYADAVDLLQLVNDLIDFAVSQGAFTRCVDVDTGSEVSGSRGGSGDGGFRLADSSTGSPNSSHKQAKAVDVYDPGNRLDDWLTDETLADFGLYREAPDSTPGWCHLSTRAPGSGRRTFNP